MSIVIDRANLSDAEALQRILNQAIDEAAIGAPNGVAGTDSSGKVPTEQLPSSITGGMVYKGTWDASTGVYPSDPEQGYYYIASVGGTISGTVYEIGDWSIIHGFSHRVGRS